MLYLQNQANIVYSITEEIEVIIIIIQEIKNSKDSLKTLAKLMIAQ
jgi:hypothetical protein